MSCGTAGHHKLAECPLVLALMHDGDVELATRILGNLVRERYLPQGCLHVRKHISPSQVQVVKCPPDGNCLFAALGMAMTICMDKPMPSNSERTELVASIRNRFLTEIEKWIKSRWNLATFRRDLHQELPGCQSEVGRDRRLLTKHEASNYE